MILSFADRDTERISRGEAVKRLPPDIIRVAARKLRQLNSVSALKELAIPPGNRLELLKGARKGQYSLRINDQWRICFIWAGKGPADVEIVDYHS
jgi:toxin HigB-1